jgi:hypothetical protein
MAKRRGIRVALTVAAAVLVVAVVCLCFWIWGDTGPPDDSDLRVERSVVADSENGYFDLVQIKGRVWWPDGVDEDQHRRIRYARIRDETDEALAKTCIQRNRAMLDQHIESSIEKPEFESPTVVLFGEPLELMPVVREAVRLLVLRSAVHRRDGRLTESLTDLGRALEIARRIACSRGSSMYAVYGDALNAGSLGVLRDTVSDASIEPDELLLLSRLVARTSIPNECYSAVLKCDYLNVRDVIDRVGSGELSCEDLKRDYGKIYSLQKKEIELGASCRSRYRFKPNESARLAARLFRSLLRQLDHYAPEVFRSENESISAFLDDPDSVSRNRTGYFFLANWFITGEGLVRKFHHSRFRARALSTWLALRAWEQTHGELPGDLDALVPEYIEQVPTDPFDGRPLHYSRDGRILYSVGSDLRDDGGADASLDDDYALCEDDPTVRIPQLPE